MKMEPIDCSETSAVRTQTPGNYPKENITYRTRRKLKINKSRIDYRGGGGVKTPRGTKGGKFTGNPVYLKIKKKQNII